MVSEKPSAQQMLGVGLTLLLVQPQPGSASFWDYIWKPPDQMQRMSDPLDPKHASSPIANNNSNPMDPNRNQYVTNYNTYNQQPESSGWSFWSILSAIWNYNLISSLFSGFGLGGYGGYGGYGGGWGMGQPGYAGGGGWGGGGPGPSSGGSASASSARKEKVINPGPGDVWHEPYESAVKTPSKQKSFPLLPFGSRRSFPRFGRRGRRSVGNFQLHASKKLDGYDISEPATHNQKRCSLGEGWNAQEQKCLPVSRNGILKGQDTSRKWHSLRR